MKQHLVRIVLGLVIVLLFIGHAAKYYQVGIVSQLDHIIYDARLRLTMPRGVDERIVILDIDERSLQEVSRWPWPRDVMAGVMTKLLDKHQVAVVAFDIVFAEPDYSSGIKRLDELAAKDLKQVPAFAEIYEKLRPSLDGTTVSVIRESRNRTGGRIPTGPGHSTAAPSREPDPTVQPTR